MLKNKSNFKIKMMFKKRVQARGLLIVMMFALLVLFQNCQPVLKFSGSDEFPFGTNGINLSNNSEVSGGNGDGYGGKLRAFYRFTPEFTCEGKEAPVASIAVTETSVTFTENKKLFCGAVTTELTPEQIERSIFQDDIIGYREGIFQSEKSAPSSIPANLVEVWCRDTADRSGIETITHYDRSTQLAVTRIHTAGAGSSTLTVSDFNVSRVISPMLVTVTDGQNFKLKVYRDRPAAQVGLFQGALEAVVNGQTVTRETSCRLGGSLDVKSWPSQEIVDLNIESFKYSADLQNYGFTSHTGATVTDLFSGNVFGKSQSKLNAPTTSGGVRGFEFTPDSTSLVYWANERLKDTYELFKIGRDGTGYVQLEALASSNVNNAVNSKLEFSSDGSRLVYMDNPLLAGNLNNETLNSVLLRTGGSTVLSPALPNASLFHFFAVSKSQNYVAFTFGTYASDLYISKLDGTGLFKAVIPYPNDGWSLVTDITLNPLEWSGASPYVFVRSLRTSGSFGDIMYSAIAADGSRVVSLPINWHRLFSDSTGSTVLLSNNLVSPAYRLMDLNTGALVDISSTSLPIFSNDGSSLIGTQVDVNGKAHAVAIDVRDGKSTAICPQVSLKTANYKELQDGTWLVATADDARDVFNFYASRNGLCVLRNSLPLSKPVIHGIYPMPDLKNLVVHLATAETNLQQLFFVPLDGRPPLRIDSPVISGAKVTSVQVLSDSRSVIYTGSQINAESHAFRWKAP